MNGQVIEWLLECDEPWTRYRILVDLLDRPQDDGQVLTARNEMLDHPQIQTLMAEATHWGDSPFKRHNDAGYPIYQFSTLADFGLRHDDPGMQPIVQAVLAHQSDEGAFQTLVNIPKAFGGNGEDSWTWITCDTPTLLYALLAVGLQDDPRVRQAADHLLSLRQDNGWRCTAAPELGKFKGPGKRSDPCPIANVYALKALSQLPDMHQKSAVQQGIEMLLSHWQERGKQKFFLFGIGTDFSKLKYPFVWYNILHVTDVLSRFDRAHADPRFQDMVDSITDQADDAGRYTATSMYRAWKGWSFADKKHPSPWLAFLVLRILKRSQWAGLEPI